MSKSKDIQKYRYVKITNSDLYQLIREITILNTSLGSLGIINLPNVDLLKRKNSEDDSELHEDDSKLHKVPKKQFDELTSYFTAIKKELLNRKLDANHRSIKDIDNCISLLSELAPKENNDSIAFLLNSIRGFRTNLCFLKNEDGTLRDMYSNSYYRANTLEVAIQQFINVLATFENFLVQKIGFSIDALDNSSYLFGLETNDRPTIKVSDLNTLCLNITTLFNTKPDLPSEIATLPERLKETISAASDTGNNIDLESLNNFTQKLDSFIKEQQAIPESSHTESVVNSENEETTPKEGWLMRLFNRKWPKVATSLIAVLGVLVSATGINSIIKKNKKTNDLPPEDTTSISGQVPDTYSLTSEPIPTTTEISEDMLREAMIFSEENVNTIYKQLQGSGLSYSEDEIKVIIQGLNNGDQDYINAFYDFYDIITKSFHAKFEQPETVPRPNIVRYYAGNNKILISWLDFFEIVPDALGEAMHDPTETNINIANSYIETILQLARDLLSGQMGTREGTEWWNDLSDVEKKVLCTAVWAAVDITKKYKTNSDGKNPQYTIYVNGNPIDIFSLYCPEFVNSCLRTSKGMTH